MTTVTIAQIIGQAWIREDDGTLTPLQQGMEIPADANVITGEGATLSLQPAGQQPFVISGDRDVRISAEIAQTDVDPNINAAAPSAEGEAILAALDAGDDPFANLEATAAVIQAGGDGAGGSNFTRLASVIETTNPLGIEYPRPELDNPEDVRLGGLTAGDDDATDDIVLGAGDGDTGDTGAGDIGTPTDPAIPEEPTEPTDPTDPEDPTDTDLVLGTTVLTITSPDQIVEGTPYEITAQVTNPVTGSPLVVELSNGLTIVIPVGESTGTAMVDVGSDPTLVRPDDAYIQGNDLHEITIDGTQGGNYQDLDTSSSTVTTIVDDVDPTIATLTVDSNDALSGGEVTYTITLSNSSNLPIDQHGKLTFTLDSGQEITIDAGETIGSITVPVTGTGPITNSIAGQPTMDGGSTFENLTTQGETQVNLSAPKNITVTGHEDLTPDISQPDDTEKITISLDADDTADIVDSYVITSLPTNGVLYINGNAVTSVGNDGLPVAKSDVITFEPTLDWAGDTNFNYYAVDAGGNQSSDAVVDINIIPVTDIPTVDLTIGEPTEQGGTQVINIGNVNLSEENADKGFNVSAWTKESQNSSEYVSGTISTIPFDASVGGGHVNGFGVAGKVSNDGDIKEIDPYEIIRVNFDEPVTDLSVKFSWLATNEYAKYTIYDSDGNAIGTDIVRGVTDKIDDPYNISAKFPDAEISYIEFTGAAQGDVYVDANGNETTISNWNSDFVIHEITYNTIGTKTYPLDIIASPSDIDGSEEIISVVVKIPESATISHGEYSAEHGGWVLPLDSSQGYTVTETVDANGNKIGGIQIDGVTVTLPADADLDVEVTVTAREINGDASDTQSASTSQSIVVEDTEDGNPVDPDPTDPIIDPEISISFIGMETIQDSIELGDGTEITIPGNGPDPSWIVHETNRYHNPGVAEIIYIPGVSGGNRGTVDGTYNSVPPHGAKYIVLEGSPDRYEGIDLLHYVAPEHAPTMDTGYYGGTLRDKSGQLGDESITFSFIKGFIFTDGTVIESGNTTKYDTSTQYQFQIDASLNVDVDDGSTTGDLTIVLNGIDSDQIQSLVNGQGENVNYSVSSNEITISGLTQAQMEGLILTIKTDANPDDWSVDTTVKAMDANNNEVSASDSINVILGTDGADAIEGTADNDVIIGGLGDDLLSGGAGDDTFVWNFGDQAAPGETATTDTVVDFGLDGNDPMGDDKLDLSDLLKGGQGEDGKFNLDSLDGYLSVGKDGSDTVISVSSKGDLGSSGADQLIVLKGVDFGDNSSNEIINNLIQQGKLVVDSSSGG